MIHFALPQLLWLLAALPLILLLRGRVARPAAVRVSSTLTARAVGRTGRGRFGRFATALRLVAASLLVISLARPQISHARTEVKASGVDLVLALDVSRSMDALDFQIAGERVRRVDAVKAVVSEFIRSRPNDRMGLVAFAGQPYLVSPLTLDHDWLRKNLERVDTGLVEDGTAIGSGLAAATDRLKARDAKSKAVILLTDGVNNTGKIQPELAAEAAKALGIKVYTIAVGSDGEAPVPVTDERGRTRIVMAEADVDEKTLQHIARSTGGEFYRAKDHDSLQRIYASIDKLERTERTLKRYERHQELFPWFLLPALGLIAFELVLAATRLRRIP